MVEDEQNVRASLQVADKPYLIQHPINLMLYENRSR